MGTNRRNLLNTAPKKRMKFRLNRYFHYRSARQPPLIGVRQIAGRKQYGPCARRMVRFGRRRMTRSGRRDAISYRHRTSANTSILFVRILSRISPRTYTHGYPYPYHNRLCLRATRQNAHRPFFYAHSRKLLFFSVFIPDLSHVACNLTIFRERERETYIHVR